MSNIDADHYDYYERRAAKQLELAQNAVLPAVVAAHYQIASAYLDRIYANEDGDCAH